MLKVISTANEKGGIGKTTTAINLARELTLRGYKVLLLDLDSQGNASNSLGYIPDGKATIYDILNLAITGMVHLINIDDAIRTSKEGVDYIPSNKLLDGIDDSLDKANKLDDNGDRLLLKELFKQPTFLKYDFIILDNRTKLTALVSDALKSSNGVIIPVFPTNYGWDGLQSFRDKVESIKNQSNKDLNVLGVLINNKPSNGNAAKEITEAIQDTFEDEVFNTVIGYSHAQAENSSQGDINSYSYRSSAFRKGFSDFTDEVLQRVKKLDPSFEIKSLI